MHYDWDVAKNEWLVKERGISFEEIVWHIAQGHLLDVLISDKESYKGQKQLVININGYAYLVPIIEQGEVIIMKTIIPSRKLTRRYLDKEGARNGEA
jgi:uncharacterized DUF497 family protein